MSSFPIVPLPRVVIEPTVRDALREDLGRGGDVTTNAVIDADLRTRCALTARQPGRLAGLDAAQIAFELLSPSLHFEARLYDGADLAPGDVIAVIEGDARGILSAERVALNFLGHLSGVASTTYQLVEKIEGTRARICCTRKTTPGLRALEKYAVRAGGGVNHRFGLDDGILIKDNHVAVAGGIAAALARVRARTGHMVKVEIEVDTLEQLDEVLDHDVDAILLDNMPPPTLRTAVERVAGRALTEASGRVTLESVRPIAEAGVDLISAGWITHSAPTLYIGLDYVD